MKKKKEYKLIREINEIIENPDLHFWIKCKELTQIETHCRPGSYAGAKLVRSFFKTCAGKYKDQFESAYVRPYSDNCWWADRHYDLVNKIDLDQDKTTMIGRTPRGIKLIRKLGSPERFDNYLRRKYPEAFEEFEEIKKVERQTGSFETRRTEDGAWQHIFYAIGRNYYASSASRKGLLSTTKEVQKNRRKLDLAMGQAAEDYKKLKKASGLPPRYLYNEVSLAKLQYEHKNHTYAIFNEHYITTETVLHYDSSEVHYGIGMLKSTDRKISIRNKNGRCASSTLKSYAGHFVLNAIEECFDRVKKVAVPEELKPVQLNPKMELVEIAIGGKFRIFRRQFDDVLYDYCVLRDGITYHGASIERCMAGWKRKKAISKGGAKIFNMKILKSKFGFCSDGIRSFCSSNGLDIHETYTLAEVKQVVNKNLLYNRSYFGNELKQIGALS